MSDEYTTLQAALAFGGFMDAAETERVAVWAAEEIERLRAESEALKAEALEVCGITYGMLTAGIVDDHDRIMRACNELAEFGRRLTGDAEALRRRSVGTDETEAVS